MKKLLLILLASLFILAGCDATESIDTPKADIYNLEIGKFPGEKYTTFLASFTNEASGKVISDSYDPLKNNPGEQPYFLQYSNQNIDKYTFTYNNKECYGYSADKSAGYLEFFNDFCPYFLLKYVKIPNEEVDFYDVYVWGDNGNVRSLLFDETLKGDGDLSEETLIGKANEIASRYIDITKYEVKYDEKTREVRYEQKIGELYLAEPHAVIFMKNGMPKEFRFSRVDADYKLNYDIEAVKRSVREIIVNRGLDDDYENGSLVVKEIVICKYDVPVAISEAVSNGITYTFYTKLCD